MVIKQSRLILQFPPAGKSAGRVHYEKTKRKHNIYTSHTPSGWWILIVSRYITLVLPLGLCIGPPCKTGLSTGTWREHLLWWKKERKKERKKEQINERTKQTKERKIERLWQDTAASAASQYQCYICYTSISSNCTCNADIVWYDGGRTIPFSAEPSTKCIIHAFYCQWKKSI